MVRLKRADLCLRLAPLLVLAALAGIFFGLGLNRYVTLKTLRDHEVALNSLVGTHPFLSVAAFVSVYVFVIVLSLPGGAVMTMSGGFLFGLWTGSLLSLCSATVGAVGIFSIARFAAGGLLRARASPFISGMAREFQRSAFTYLLFLRLVPLFPFWVVNLAPAVLEMPLRPFLMATAIGIIPDTLAYASVGDSLSRYFAAGSQVSMGKVFSPDMIAARAGLAVLALIPIGVRWMKQRRRP